MTVRDSTVFRDLAQHLDRAAQRLIELGYLEWAGHLLEDADRLLKHGERLAGAEPSRPSIASLAGIDPEFRSAEPERGVSLETIRDRYRGSMERFGSPVLNWQEVDWLLVEVERLRQREATLRQALLNEREHDEAHRTTPEGRNGPPRYWQARIAAIDAALEQGGHS